MRVAFIANVGMRDVVVERDGEDVRRTWPGEKEGLGPRNFGEQLLKGFDEYAPRLSAPILKPLLAKVFEKHARIERVLLFVTNQHENEVDARAYQADTVSFGAVLTRLLPRLFPDRIGVVECSEIRRNPHIYDEMIEFYKRELPACIKRDEFDEVWVTLTAGIPACTTAALLNAVREYRLACRTVYLPEKQQEPRQLDIHHLLLGDFAREQARAHLERYDFLGVRKVLEGARLGEQWHRRLCTYADRRLHFDFEGARRSLEEALTMNPRGAALQQIERCRDSLAQLMMNANAPTSKSSRTLWDVWLSAQSARLSELYFNLRIKVQREEWFDFLARLYRLREGAFRLMFERATGHSAQKDNKRDFDRFFTKDKAQLAERAKQKNIYVSQLAEGLELHAVREGKSYDTQLQRNKRIEKLCKVRHRSIVAHGYAGVNRALLEKELDGVKLTNFVDQDLRGFIAEPLVGAAVSPNDDPFRDVISWLHEAIES